MSVVTRIRTSEELTVPFTPEEIWDVLAAASAYPDWWPVQWPAEVLSDQPGLLGSEIEVRPLLGGRFRFRFEEMHKPFAMRLRFFGGRFEGPGGFLLEPGEKGRTRIRYDIDVFARGMGTAAVSQVLPLDAVQRFHMRSLLRNLEKQVRRQRKAAEARLRAEAKAARVAAEAARLAAKEEARRLAAEMETRRIAEAEAARLATEEAARRAAQEAERRRAAEDARLAVEAEGVRLAAETAARLAAAEEKRRLAMEEAARRATQEAESRRVAEEARVAEEVRVAAEVSARLAAEEEARRLATALEARRIAEAEAIRIAAAEAERRRAVEDARLAAEAEAGRLREESRVLVEAEARRAELRRHEEAELARIAAEAAARLAAEEEARRLAAEDADRRRAAEEATRRLASEHAAARAAQEAESRRVGEEARLAEEARIASETAARLAAEQEARRLAAEGETPIQEEVRAWNPPARPTVGWLRRIYEWFLMPEVVVPEAPAAPGGDTNFTIARDYLSALSSRPSPKTLDVFLAQGLIRVEYPHRFLDRTTSNSVEGTLGPRAREAGTFAAETFELRGATGGGSQVAMEIAWSGRVGQDAAPLVKGQELDARLAVFLKFQDGRIVREHVYACFEPWSNSSERARVLAERTSAEPVVPKVGDSGPGSSQSNFEIARSYLAAMNAGAGPEDVVGFFAEDGVQEEFPNIFAPEGVVRTRNEIGQARGRDLALFKSEYYELGGAFGGGSQVAMEIAWTAVIGAQKLEGHLAVFLKFRDGLIVRERIYRCIPAIVTVAGDVRRS